jgi:hypothetical protein
MQKEITALEKKMDKLIAAAEKSEKPKVAKKSQSVKAKTTPKNSGENSAYKKDNRPADCNRPGVTDYHQIEERG